MEKDELEIAGCMRRLLRSRYLLRSRNEKWFKAMIDHRRRLQEIVTTFAAYLEINEPLGLAYLKPLNEEIEDHLGIRLSRPRALSPFASALLIYLRWQRLQFYLQPSGGDVPIISLNEIREHLQHFSQAKVDVQFERQFRRALDELTDLQVLLETASESGFYEMTSLCDLLLPADQLHEWRTRAEVYFKRVSNAASPNENVEGESNA